MAEKVQWFNHQNQDDDNGEMQMAEGEVEDGEDLSHDGDEHGQQVDTYEEAEE